MSKRLHLDCTGGIAGDMFISALTGLPMDIEAWWEIMDRLPLPEWEASFPERSECGLMCRTLKLTLPGGPGDPRDVRSIRQTILQAKLPSEVEENSLALLQLLAEAEGKVHGEEPDLVHFHELAGFDSIFDLVGAAAAVHLLQPVTISCSSLPLGHGTVQTAHGELPLPVPVALELLDGLPVHPVDIAGETITPTGAAIARHFAGSFSTFAQGAILAHAQSAGTRKNARIPNMLRAILLEEDAGDSETLWVLECNLDNMNPEHTDFLFARLFEAGALDVWLSSIQMKKNRPAQTVSVLVRPNLADEMQRLLYLHTPTIGVRRFAVQRHALKRSEEFRETPLGTVRGKRIDAPDGSRWMPEYDELARIASERGWSIRQVLEALSATS